MGILCYFFFTIPADLAASLNILYVESLHILWMIIQLIITIFMGTVDAEVLRNCFVKVFHAFTYNLCVLIYPSV